MNKEIKPANYTKINHLSGVFVPQKALSREELYFSNNSKTANVSKSFLIPNEDLSDDTTPSVARKFLNEEAAKFVGDFKSLAKEADDSPAKHKALELEIKRLLKAVETEYAKLWNDWYKKCDECKYDKTSYDKAYKDMQRKIEWLQAQLGYLKGKSKDTLSVSDARNPLSQKLENENVELEFQVLNYARENAHLKATYKNLFDSISVSHAQIKTIIASLQNELQSNIYKNANLRTQLFKKVSDQKENTKNTSVNTKFAKQPIVENLPKIGKANTLSKPVTSNSISSPQESKDNTKTRRPQPRSNTKHDRVPSASKSSRSKNKEAKVEEHHRNLLLSKNNKHISSACNNIKIDSQDVISKVVCAMCKKCLISVNHDKCLSKNVNAKNSYGKNQKAKISVKEIQKKYQPKKIESHKSLATPTPRKSRLLLRWSPTGKLFDNEGKIGDSSESKSQLDCSNGDNACTSSILEPKIKRFPNSTSLLDRLFRFVYVWTNNNFQYKWKANDREDIGKLGAKGDIGFFIGYSADSCAYKIYNQRTKKIMETMNVSLDELSAMAFEQRTTARTVSPAQEPQVRQTSTVSTTIADTAPIPKNSSSLAINIPSTSQDVDELNPNAMVDGNTFVNPFANPSISVATASSSQQNVTSI
nr:integrase, catalytic region, zinc finger, CCHC-type, peptidase aspartic, catalytic [Tanacetum cinerariifolium]